MPVYVFLNPKTEEEFEILLPPSKRNDPYVTEDGVKCKRILFTKGSGGKGVIDKNAEVWEKDSHYVKQINPKYVRRRDGIKEKYDPTRHC